MEDFHIKRGCKLLHAYGGTKKRKYRGKRQTKKRKYKKYNKNTINQEDSVASY